MDLTISGRHYRQAIVGKEDFGEERLEFALPEFTAKTRAQLRWNVDGHPRSKKESIDPAKKWTLYMVPHIHLDVGYSDYQAKVAAIHGRVIGEVPLPIGGLMSNKSATEVAQELRHLTQVVARALGVTLEAPFMQLSFLGLSVIPELRITDRGLVDVMTCSLTDVGAV